MQLDPYFYDLTTSLSPTMSNEAISDKSQILNHRQICQKIRRMAFQLYEQNFDHTSIILAGVNGMGERLAQLLEEELKLFSPLKIQKLTIAIDKQAPSQDQVQLQHTGVDLNEQVVVIVDDVLHTGRTIAYSMKPFLNTRIEKLQLAVLVDRNHRSFPVSPDVAGYELSTTINQHVEVTIDQPENFGVFLF